MYFRDREEAGRLLGKALEHLRGQLGLLVLGIPRGGVVVAYEVARALGAPLDVYVARKIGAPQNPELALGAVASDGTQVLDSELLVDLRVSDHYVEQEVERQAQEVERRMAAYRGGRPPLEVTGRRLVLVDDGVATGATVLASLRALRQSEPSRLILAVPVGPPGTISRMSLEADEVVCLHQPLAFWAVGAFYESFDQTSDDEVVRLLDQASAF
jgi:putative phosphoribosyl transferase